MKKTNKTKQSFQQIVPGKTRKPLSRNKDNNKKTYHIINVLTQIINFPKELTEANYRSYVRWKTTKLLEYNIGENLGDVGFGD